MHILSAILSLAVFACAYGVFDTTLAASEAEPVTTASLDGEYQTIWLRLERGIVAFDTRSKERFDIPLFVGLRDGKAVVAWFVHPAMSGGRVVWLDTATLTLSDTELRGDLVGRTNLHWGDKNVRDFKYRFEAKVSGRQISGTFSAQYVDDSAEVIEFSGKLTGDISIAARTEKDRLAADRRWPHYFGDGFRFSGPTSGVKLIDDLSHARPVWKSESYIPTSYGSAPDSRYYDRAGRTDSGGGSSSPLVAEGCVYQFHYYPRGPIGMEKAFAKYETEADIRAIAESLFPKRETQQRAVVNHFRTQADETLVCLDAASGRTLWKTTFPQRGNNYQTHKHRGFFPVALVADGVVYQPSTTGRMYAVDAKTGSLIWEYPDAHPMPYVAKQGAVDCHAPGPTIIDGVVAFAASGRIHGLDAKTGMKRWERPLWHRSSLLPWNNGTRSLFIASDRDHTSKKNFAVALDPATGEIVWKSEVPYLIDYCFPLLSGDQLLGYSLKLENVKPGENDGLAIIHAMTVSADGLKPAWNTKPLAPIIDTVGMACDGEHVYVSAAREVFRLKATTGEIVAKILNVGGARTQTAFIGDGRLFIQPEGRHGAQSFFMFDASPDAFRPFHVTRTVDSSTGQSTSDLQWHPPHTWTTAYANQPIVYPLVDGRLFVRGLDAIYCYDLRSDD